MFSVTVKYFCFYGVIASARLLETNYILLFLRGTGDSTVLLPVLFQETCILSTTGEEIFTGIPGIRNHLRKG